MNLVKTISQYDDKSVFFCEPIKNNIMNDGNFIRILYSNQNIVLTLIVSLKNGSQKNQGKDLRIKTVPELNALRMAQSFQVNYSFLWYLAKKTFSGWT